jgi:hypothetical protein
MPAGSAATAGAFALLLLTMGAKGIPPIDEIGDRVKKIDQDVTTLRTVLRDISANIPYDTLESRRERLYEFMNQADKIFDQLPTAKANALLRHTLRMYIQDNQVIRIDAIQGASQIFGRGERR